ncbi:MAG: hypothetical protein HQK81_06955 [Desulfovibrionaceae bacterium]|nr:hypothetical protein [Desulfovibrionaceae bacterium]MBF0513789.1 hypothetical protein [Desulfovibrionaceae bacterium]
MKKFILMLGFLTMTMVGAHHAHAGNSSQGDITITPMVSGYGSLNSNAYYFMTYGVDLGYFVANGLELGVRGQGIYLNSKNTVPSDSANASYDLNGLGAEGFARWHFYDFGNNAGSVFATIGAGGLWMSDAYTPLSATNAYFSGVTGLGVNMNMTDNVKFMASANYRHIGNFDSTGIDGLGGTLGLQFSF